MKPISLLNVFSYITAIIKASGTALIIYVSLLVGAVILANQNANYISIAKMVMSLTKPIFLGTWIFDSIINIRSLNKK